jgi:hypothetical protein
MGLLTQEERQKLIELLLRLPDIGIPSIRNTLVAGLPPTLVNLIPFSGIPNADITSLVHTVDSEETKSDDHSWPVLIVIENAIYAVRGSRLAGELQNLRDILKLRIAQSPIISPSILSTPTTITPKGHPTLKLTAAQRRQLYEALVSAFPTSRDLERMTRYGLKENISNIASDGSLSTIVFDLIAWAESSGRLEDLITAARKANPGNEILEDFYIQMGLESSSISSPIARSTYMKLTLLDRQECHRSLLDAFPRMNDLEQLVAFNFDKPLDAITDANDRKTAILDLISWAQSQDKIKDLIRGALEKNPSNKSLRDFAVKIGLEDLPQDLTISRSELSSIGPYVHPVQLTAEDRNILLQIIQTAFPFDGTASDRRAFMRLAGLPDTWIANYNWDVPPRMAASQLLDAAASEGIPLLRLPGYTPLGAILNQMIVDRLVSPEDAQFIAAIIVRYNLIDLYHAKIPSSMRSLLEMVPMLPSKLAAEIALRGTTNSRNRYLDAKWLSVGVRVAQAVCRVEVSSNSLKIPIYGTGFLIAPNLVLTSYHVVEAVIPGKNKDNQVEAWNIKLLFSPFMKEAAAESKQISCLAEDWLVASSPTNELDYALLRIAEEPRRQDIPRPWIQPPWGTVRKGESLFVIEHSLASEDNRAALSQKLAFGAVVSVSTTRILYTANTYAGSSGAPCFTTDWQLTALHHASSLDGNEGILITSIIEQSKVKAALGT